MKKITMLLLTAGMLLGASPGAHAIDFKAKGEWLFGYGAVNTMFYGNNGADTFQATQRLRLQIDAVASETLSGTVYFEIGEQDWGRGASGGALGADGQVIELKNAYLDWFVPSSELKFRMGLQWFQNPDAAGGPAVLGSDAAGIIASYKFNESVALTAAWVRPYNDNYVNDGTSDASSNYLDNFDLFMLSLPISGNGWKVTPWVMGGMLGENLHGSNLSGNRSYGSHKYFVRTGLGALGNYKAHMSNEPAYQSMFWVGIPLTFNYDRFKFEFDFNYGATDYGGTYDLAPTRSGYDTLRVDNQRSGWVIKALTEYKLDWGTPSFMAWYASGDDGDLENGSERLPVIAPDAWFSSFVTDAAWSVADGAWQNPGYDLNLDFSGTWGIAVGINNMSFMDKLSHTLKVVYWRGTNDPENAKYLGEQRALGYDSGYTTSSFYLTQNDYLVEVNLDSTYQIYENLSATLQLGYIINGVDEDTWKHSNASNWEQQNGYKAALIFKYKF